MGLSCSCDVYDDFDWYYTVPNDYTTLKTSKRKRCSSCNDLISIGAVTAKFVCTRPARDEVEINIHGEGGVIYLANRYLCETCADLYYSLHELGFNCISPEENVIDLVKLYNKGDYTDDEA